MADCLREKDVLILRDLAKRYYEIAMSDENVLLKKKWVDFNERRISTTMLIVDEVPWWEFDCEELKNRCETPFARQIEDFFLRNLWMKENLDTDHVFDDHVKLPMVIEGCDFSITAVKESQNARADRFCDLLKTEKDIEKIKPLPISVNKEKTELNASIYNDIFADVIPVKQTGRAVLFNAWDLLETWHGVENCLFDMYDRPEFLHAIMRRITDVTKHVIKNLEALKLLERPENLCYSPLYCEMDGEEGTAKNAWIFGTAQIFSSASKEMHQEFELPYAQEIFSLFGRGYYCCCEPLHDRIDMVDKLPNVSKVSISPFANVFVAAENIGNRYIMSRKPTPSYLGTQSVNWDVIEEEIVSSLSACRSNNVSVEFILKDLTSVNGNPLRLKEWSQRARRIINEKGENT